MVAPRVRADAVDATEFGDLAQKYDVMGVPRSVFNERVALDGAVPEKMFMEALLQSVQGGTPSPERDR